tara:strand:+ start:1585 stop:1785 length:201 start_codon:yes stop_codon:yes gene_type:complete
MNFITILLGVILGLSIFGVLLIIKQIFFEDPSKEDITGIEQKPTDKSKSYVAGASSLHFENTDKKR